MRHERVAVGRVLWPPPFVSGSDCICCRLDAEGCTITAWMLWDEPGATYPMCWWCLELWEANGWLRAEIEVRA